MPPNHHQQPSSPDSLIGKKQLLVWTSTTSNIECTKYDDLRDGLIPLILFRNLFPNGIPADIAHNIRTQLNMIPMQRPSRQNWLVLSQLLKHGGIPATIWDRRSVSAAHPKACYNFLVMAYFLHKLKAGGDFSVDFALPVDVELSNFLQSPRSLDVVNRASMLPPIVYHMNQNQQRSTSSGPASRSTSAPNTPRGGSLVNPNNTNNKNNNNNYYDPSYNSSGTENQHQHYQGIDAGSSSDVTPSITPRFTTTTTTTTRNQNGEDDMSYFRNHTLNPQNTNNAVSIASSPPSHLQQVADSFLATSPPLQHQQQRSNTSPGKQNRKNAVNSNNRTPTRGGNAGSGLVAFPLDTINNHNNTGFWRYGTDSSSAALGEGVIMKLKNENAKLQDAVSVANDHVRATQRYCEAQLKFAQEQFGAEVKKIQMDAQLTKMQLESQNAITTSMLQSAAEARVREIERRILAERREANWGAFAHDAVPDEWAHQPERWLSAQLDAARQQLANERQHRIALENENAMLRDNTSKIVPIMTKLQAEMSESMQRLEQFTDPEATAKQVRDSLDQLKVLAGAMYDTKVETLEIELEAARGIRKMNNEDGNNNNNNKYFDFDQDDDSNIFSSRNNHKFGGNSGNNNTTAGKFQQLQEKLFSLQEELAMTKDLLHRAENSSGLLRELIHRNCTTPMQKLDLSAFTLDPQSDELRRGVVIHSSLLGPSAAALNENAAAVHLRHLTDVVASSLGAGTNNNVGEDDLQRIRDAGLRFALMHQILEARVQAMAQNLLHVSAILTQTEKEAAQRQISHQAQLAEMHARHQSDLQQLSAAKSADSATLQAEVQMLRTQLSRESQEHNLFCDRQAATHQSMAKDLQNQISALRQTIGEVRRAEQLLIQRDQLWSGLADSLALLGSSSASTESKHQAEMKSNQLREQLKKNAADLKSSANRTLGSLSSSSNSPAEREVADAVREAVAHSHQQLQACLDELKMKQAEVKTLEHKFESVMKENEQVRNLERRTKDQHLLAEEELKQAREKNEQLQIRASDATTVSQRVKELMEVMVTNTVHYVGDVCNQFNIRIPRPSIEELIMANNSSLNVNANTNTNNNNNNNAQTRAGNNNTTNNNTGRRYSSNVSALETPNTSMIMNNINNKDETAKQTQNPTTNTVDAGPPKLVAPKFAPIELSPPRYSQNTNATNDSISSNPNSVEAAVAAIHQKYPVGGGGGGGAKASATSDATTIAADTVLDDFARKQKEILEKYGIKS